MDKHDTKELSQFLLETGSLLMSSGANTNRIRITTLRIANAYGYNAELLIMHRALMLTLNSTNEDNFYSSIKKTQPHGANFRIVSGISKLSWQIAEEKIALKKAIKELNRLQSLPHYPRILILIFVALAGASFCRLFGGGAIEMAVTFTATFIGLFVRQEAIKKKFNPYLCVFFGAFTSSLIAGLSVKLNIGEHPDFAFATSVLYLIPGIPLINSLTDLLDGNIMNGIVRGVNGLIIAFAIALGLLGAILIYNIG